MSSRPLSADEKTPAGGLVECRIGVDGVALIANSSKPVTKLSREHGRAIYTGQITNWKELSGPAAPIVLYSLNSKHGTHEVFMNYFGLEAKESGEGAAPEAVHRKRGDEAYSPVTAKALDDTRQEIAAILTNPNTLGYVFIGIAAVIAQRGAPIRVLDLDGVAARKANVKSGAYQLSRPLLLLTKGEAKGKTPDFINYLSGPDGKSIVEQLDYMPVGKQTLTAASPRMLLDNTSLRLRSTLSIAALVIVLVAGMSWLSVRSQQQVLTKLSREASNLTAAAAGRQASALEVVLSEHIRASQTALQTKTQSLAVLVANLAPTALLTFDTNALTALCQ